MSVFRAFTRVCLWAKFVGWIFLVRNNFSNREDLMAKFKFSLYCGITWRISWVSETCVLYFKYQDNAFVSVFDSSHEFFSLLRNSNSKLKRKSTEANPLEIIERNQRRSIDSKEFLLWVWNLISQLSNYSWLLRALIFINIDSVRTRANFSIFSISFLNFQTFLLLLQHQKNKRPQKSFSWDNRVIFWWFIIKVFQFFAVVFVLFWRNTKAENFIHVVSNKEMVVFIIKKLQISMIYDVSAIEISLCK